MRDADQTGPRGAAYPKRDVDQRCCGRTDRPGVAHPGECGTSWVGRPGSMPSSRGRGSLRSCGATVPSASAGPAVLSTLWTTGCGYPHSITGGCWDAVMNASGATPPTATVFDALLSTGLSAADADSELRSGSGTISERGVYATYTPVTRTDSVCLDNTLVTSVMPTAGTLRLPGH